MPTLSWFQKLRSRTKKKKKRKQAGSPAGAAADGGAGRKSVSSASNNCQSLQAAPSSKPAAVCAAVSPNRASYYFPSADRARQDRLRCITATDAGAEAALDVRVDVVHRREGEERRRRLGGIDAPPGTPELKLRPIVVSRRDACASDDGFSVSSATTSAATTPSTRARGFHVKPASVRTPHHHHHHRRRRARLDHDDGGGARKNPEKAVAVDDSPSQQHQDGGTRRRRWLYESLVVVKASSDPESELAESMAEMVLANGIRPSSEDLEELLACYLALNAAEHHRAVVAAFRRVWVHLLARHVVDDVDDQPATRTEP